MKLTIHDLTAERQNLLESYRLEIEAVAEILGKARQQCGKVAPDTIFSTHNAFNLAARAQDLQGLASKIQCIDNILYWENKS